MRHKIPQPPVTFDLAAFAERWFHWQDIAPCFWPGSRRRSIKVNPVLCPVRFLGGVYVIARSLKAPNSLHPTHAAVQYVGETGNFNRRMRQFGTSAGFFGPRAKGHSAAWRWPLGRKEHLWVAFFEVGGDLLPHLAKGMRHWMEAVALEEHRQLRGALPALNRVEEGEITALPLEEG